MDKRKHKSLPFGATCAQLMAHELGAISKAGAVETKKLTATLGVGSGNLQRLRDDDLLETIGSEKGIALTVVRLKDGKSGRWWQLLPGRTVEEVMREMQSKLLALQKKYPERFVWETSRVTDAQRIQQLGDIVEEHINANRQILTDDDLEGLYIFHVFRAPHRHYLTAAGIASVAASWKIVRASANDRKKRTKLLLLEKFPPLIYELAGRGLYSQEAAIKSIRREMEINEETLSTLDSNQWGNTAKLLADKILDAVKVRGGTGTDRRAEFNEVDVEIAFRSVWNSVTAPSPKPSKL